MKKLNMKFMSFVLAVFMLVSGTVMTVGATESIEKTNLNIIQPRVTCINGCSSLSILVCRDDGKYDYTTTHKYGAFLSATCTIRHYTSRYVGFVCPECLNVQSVGIDVNAYHDCYEVHSSCGNSKVVYCRGGGIM